MKVNIDDYPSPFIKVDRITYFISRTFNLSEKTEDKVFEIINNSFIKKIDNWLHDKRLDSRKAYVRIDDSDLYSLDHTLALAILPALEKFKENDHAFFYVDDSDIPDELLKAGMNEQEKYHYVLDRMIFSFNEAIDGYYGHRNGFSEYKEYIDEVQRGFNYFGRYYMELWT